MAATGSRRIPLFVCLSSLSFPLFSVFPVRLPSMRSRWEKIWKYPDEGKAKGIKGDSNCRGKERRVEQQHQTTLNPFSTSGLTEIKSWSRQCAINFFFSRKTSSTRVNTGHAVVISTSKPPKMKRRNGRMDRRTDGQTHL